MNLPFKSKHPKINLQQKAQFNKSTASLFSVVAASFGILVILRSFASTPAPTGTYTDWNWPSQNFNSFEWQVTPGVDQTGPDAYFFSHQFGFVGGQGGYAGMQGDTNGKRAVFSIWEALAASGPGKAQPFGGEGTGYQTIIDYQWVTGRTYTYKVQRLSAAQDGYWWGATVTDASTGIASTIGQIKVPLGWGGLGNFSIAWIERYTGQMSTCNDVHHAKVAFTNFTANNGTVLPTSHNNHLAQPVNCPGSQFTDVRNGVIQEMGVGNDLPPVVQVSAGTYLSDLTPTYLSNGYGALQKDLSVGAHPITLNGQRYAKGLGAHASADLRYSLAGKYSAFKAYVGVDDEVGNAGSVSFQVWADGAKLFDSGNMTGPSPTQAVSVDVTGKQELKLIITDAGDGINFDHANWADAKLMSAAPSSTPTSTSRPPTASVSGPTSATVNQTVTYNASANDPDGNLNMIEIYTAPHNVQNFTLVKSCSLATASPGTCSTSWTPTAAGSYDVVVNAYDSSNGKCSGNPNVSYPYYDWTSCGPTGYLTVNVSSVSTATPPPPPPPTASGDSIAPVVTISSPANGAIIGNGTYITASSKDNVAVTKMQVLIDGGVVNTTTGSSVAYTWVSYYAKAGYHTITIKAYDAAGNVGQSSVTVKK